MLRGFPNAKETVQMEEKGWQQRPTNAMTCLDRSFATWSEFLAANLLIDTAFTTLLSAAVSSPYEPLRQRAAKITQEEAGHWVHGAGWVRRAPAHLSAALAAVWDDAFTWFGQADDPVLRPLGEAGILSDNPEGLRRKLRARLEPLLDEAEVGEPLFTRELPWAHWDADRRRLRV